MAKEILDIINRKENKVQRPCDSGCKYFSFPHFEVACVLSSVYSVKQKEGCYIYEQKRNS